ncbi:hypothetical protein SAMN05444350_104150 [Bacteroides stercorirosoris]|uniref:Right-handed parallel beta-helix repeat-containing protein n=2 Tax=Bacteroides stercorirosoris TaxID=871324 RepID=A0A1M6CHI0_9BACE|nr:hypothetical protein SAMN05444350_104150 [Bacteroides stercorirosoris]
MYGMKSKALYLIYIVPVLFLLSFAACDDMDDYSSDPKHTLWFSQDTLHMDTVLTGIPTSTRQLKVYNPHKKTLLISSIILADAGKSGFRINVDGIKGNQFSDIEIAGEDSLYIFVEATLPQRDNTNIRLIKDSILFQLNGIRQEVKLRAYAQDVFTFRGKVIEKDTLIASERPILIYDSISVAPDAHLTLAAGTRFYFHGKAGMQVHGRLSVEGTLSAPVVFRGDRTDRLFPYLTYDRLPGQWGGIRFLETSYDNHLVYADIHGGSFGIRCDSSKMDRRKLILESSIIRQVSGNGLELTSCQAVIGNCEISNAGENCVSLLGGDYTFTHCTLANYFSWNVRTGVALQVRNEQDDIAYPLSSATFRNCIIAGSGSDEINGGRSKNENIAFNYYFSHSLINSVKEENDRIVRVIWEKDDNFLLMDNRTQEYNFNLNENSKAISLGKKEDASAYPTDRNGKSRLQDKAPNAGCYE